MSGITTTLPPPLTADDQSAMLRTQESAIFFEGGGTCANMRDATPFEKCAQTRDAQAFQGRAPSSVHFEKALHPIPLPEVGEGGEAYILIGMGLV